MLQFSFIYQLLQLCTDLNQLNCIILHNIAKNARFLEENLLACRGFATA